MAKKRRFNGKPNLNKFVVISSNIVIYITTFTPKWNTNTLIMNSERRNATESISIISYMFLNHFSI